MTLHELLDEVKLYTGRSGEEALMVTLLNRAMVRIARDLGLPRLHIDVNGVLSEFELNAASVGYDVREVITAYRDDPGATPLPLLSAFEANRMHSGWRNWPQGNTRFLIYDPGVMGLGTAVLTPVPAPKEPESYVIACVVRPSVMEEMSDEPFNGLLPEYHVMLAHYVASELLVIAGDQRAGLHRSMYEELVRAAFMYAKPDGVPYASMRSPFWSDS